MKEQKSVKKLVLRKETVSNLEILSREELNGVKAAFDPCWENLYTAYYCRLVRTGGKPNTQDGCMGALAATIDC